MPKQLTPEDIAQIIADALSGEEEVADIRQVVPASLTKPRTRKKNSKLKAAILLPDAQIGFRRYEDETWDPFHDNRAIDVAFQITAMIQEEHQVDKVLLLGDMMDLPAQGKYDQEPSFANTINKTLQAGHNFFSTIRALAPHSEIVYLEGNHDCRMEKYVRNNAPTIATMRQVNSPFPVNSLPHLMRFDEIGVDYVSGYPASAYWVNPRLQAVHGNRANSNGSTALQHLNKNPLVSTLFGHSHRFEMMYKTHNTPDGPKDSMAFSPGCLCRVDGAVPSYNGGINIHEKPVTFYENWQQGIGVLWYREDGYFAIDPVRIHDGKALYRGQEFVSSL